MRTSPLHLQDFLGDEPAYFPINTDDQEEDEESIDIEAIEAAAYERGRADGTEEANVAQQQSLESELIGTLQAAASNLTAVEDQVQVETLSLLKAVLTPLLPSFAETGIATEAAIQINEFLANKSRTSAASPRLKVRAASDTAAKIAEYIETAGVEDFVHCIGDEEFDPIQVSVEWRDGGADLDPRSLIESVLESLQQAIDENQAGRNNE